VQVAVGGHQVCLRYPGGAMICWGEVRGRTDDVDPLLVTTEVDEETLAHHDPGRATALVPGMLDVADMSCGRSFCCALRSDESLWCWGMVDRWNAPGQNPPPANPRLPAPVPGLDDVAAIIGSGSERLAMSSRDDDLLTVGGATVLRAPVSDWPHAPVTGVAYSTRGASLIANGQVYANCLEIWRGECGFDSIPSDAPHLPDFMRPAGYIDDAVDLAAWDDTRCALRASGEVWCWGDARVIWEQSMHGSYEQPQQSWAPTRVEALADIVALEASDHAFCALRADHQLVCWGIDTSGILRTGHTDGEVWSPYALRDASDVVDFDLNDTALCVIRENGEVACTAQLPPDAPRHGHHRGDLVRVPNLPDLPADFMGEPSEVPLDSDGGV